MIIVIDFDDTLIATTKGIKPKLFSLKEFGVSSAQARRTYLSSRNLFSLGKYVEALEINISKRKQIVGKLNKIFDTPKKYNYEGVEWFLQQLKNKGHFTILLTFGDKKFQTIKIKQSGLNKLFNRAIFTKEFNKATELKKIKKTYNKSIILIDDSIEPIETAGALDIKTILVKKGSKDKFYYRKLLKMVS